jgi:hypothetical protein
MQRVRESASVRGESVGLSAEEWALLLVVAIAAVIVLLLIVTGNL